MGIILFKLLKNYSFLFLSMIILIVNYANLSIEYYKLKLRKIMHRALCCLFVAIGGIIGALTRYGFTQLFIVT